MLNKTIYAQKGTNQSSLITEVQELVLVPIIHLYSHVYRCGEDFMGCLCQANPVVHEVEQSFLLEQLEADFPDLDPQTDDFLY